MVLPWWRCPSVLGPRWVQASGLAFTLRESACAGITGLVGGSFTPDLGRRARKGEERVYSGEEQRPSLVEVGGGRRT